MRINSAIYVSIFSLVIVIIFTSCNASKKATSPEPELKVLNVETKEPKPETIANFLSEYLNLKYKNYNFDKYMYVSVKHQRLYLIENDSTIKKYPISTAKKGIGSKQNSYKTPPGLHTVKRKIGDGVPLGGIFESREYDGKIAKILEEEKKAPGDFVTTRIMWLQGEEPGINKGRNVDSYNRYIYIHGTPEEGFIGKPASHGCIRMKNEDVVELFNMVDEGTPILILKY